MDSDITIVEKFTDFDPAVVANLPQATPITIRSIAIGSKSESESLVYVGTGGGKLILFSIDSSLNDSVRFVELISIGTRVIESILVLSEIQAVLVLSDGFLYLADWSLSKSVKKLGFLKEVTVVARRFRTENEASTSEITSKGNMAPGSSETQFSNSCFVVAAMGRKLVLIEMISSENNVKIHLKEMLGVEGIKALAWINDSIFVGNSNKYFLIASETGKNNEIFTFPESSRSTKLRPLSKNTEILLLMDNLGVIVDLFGQPRGNSLVFKFSPDLITELGAYTVICGDEKLDIYRRRNGDFVQSVDLGQFGNFTSSYLLLGGDEMGRGEILMVANTRKVICFRKASMEDQIKTLLRKKNYETAISLSEELMSDGEITKNTLSFVHAQIGFLLFFDLRFKEAVDHFLLSENLEPSEIFPFIMRDPNRWSELVPRNRYWGLHPPPVPLEEVIDEGLAGVQRAIFLKKAGVDVILDESFISNPPSRSTLSEQAIRNIIRYLVAARDKELSPEMKEGVDTLLMYLYRTLDMIPEMENLASSENSCVVKELEALLEDSRYLRTLAFLYGNKQMASESLASWHLLARNYVNGLWRENNNSDVSEQEGSVSGERIAAREASKLLELSSDQDLVLEHFGWISDIDEELAVAVLISEKRTNQLSPDSVLAAIDAGKVSIRERYLQWLIDDQACELPQYHTLYALSLARSALDSLSSTATIQTESSQREKMNGDLSEDSNESFYSVRERLQLFLQASDLYDAEELLYLIEDSELWLEKAILYRKMGQENIVLQILALKLEDNEAAEQYCTEIGRDDAYIQLLDLYLDPQNGREPMFTAAVRLLHNHGESLDPLQVLEKLSPEMPLQLASDTILRMLRARLHHHRQGQIVHNISKAINLDARLARMEERSRHVQLTDETVCDSCHTLLGTKLFVMYPDDSVVCYRCYRNQGESSNGRNFKKDVSFRPGWLVRR